MKVEFNAGTVTLQVKASSSWVTISSTHDKDTMNVRIPAESLEDLIRSLMFAREFVHA